jgi:aryl sulfotransferase
VIRHLPNVLFVYFADLKGDMGGGIRTIAEFREIAVDETVWLDILKNCRFDHMKANHTKSVPLGSAVGDGSAQTFIHKGQNGRWRDVLTEASCQAYEARAQQELGPGKFIRRDGSGISIPVPAATPDG